MRMSPYTYIGFSRLCAVTIALTHAGTPARSMRRSLSSRNVLLTMSSRALLGAAGTMYFEPGGVSFWEGFTASGGHAPPAVAGRAFGVLAFRIAYSSAAFSPAGGPIHEISQ